MVEVVGVFLVDVIIPVVVFAAGIVDLDVEVADFAVVPVETLVLSVVFKVDASLVVTGVESSVTEVDK